MSNDENKIVSFLKFIINNFVFFSVSSSLFVYVSAKFKLIGADHNEAWNVLKEYAIVYYVLSMLVKSGYNMFKTLTEPDEML